MEKIKVTISRENGEPISLEAGTPGPMFLDDRCKFMVIKKDGETVESLATSSLFDLLEFIERELKQAKPTERESLRKAFGWGPNS